jgi:hypothetical protein
MAKRIALKDSVKVDTTDLSTFCRAVSFTSEHARVDVSGFNAAGVDEFLAGSTTQSVTCEFYGSYGTAEVHQTVYPIHKNRTIVASRGGPPNSRCVTGPELRGNVRVSPTTHRHQRRRRRILLSSHR